MAIPPETKGHSGDGPTPPAEGCLRSFILAALWPWPPEMAHPGSIGCYPFSNSDSSPQSGQFNEDMIPTVGFNMRKITKGNVTIKVSGREPKLWPQLGPQESPCVHVRAGHAEGDGEGICDPWEETLKESGGLDSGGKSASLLRRSEGCRDRRTGQQGSPWAGEGQGGGERRGGLGSQDGFDCLLAAETMSPFLTQLWDIGGQPRFRSMWERYCRGVSAIV